MLRNKRLFATAGAAGVLLIAAVGWFAAREKAAPAPTAPPPVAAQPIDSSRANARAPRGSLPSRGTPASGAELDSRVRSGLRAQPSHGEAGLPAGAVNARPAAGNQPEPGVGLEPDLIAADAARAQGVAATPPPPMRETLPRFTPQPVREPEAEPPPTLAVSPTRIPRTAEPTRPPVEPEAAPAPKAAAARAPEPTTAPATSREPEVAAAPARPEVRVERTQWHPTPDKRSALVRVGENGASQELREGDAVDGVVVKEIRPSGVLFLYEGEEFRRGIGES